MYAVYGPTGKMIYGPVLAAGDAHAYVTEASGVCDTYGWIVLPVEIMAAEKPINDA